jgi:rhamnosyl/mannosyltransferase
MRILQLTKFYPPVMGGIESVVFELVEGLNRAQHRTDVLCANQSLRRQAETLPAGYSVTRVASFGKFLSTSMAPSMIPSLARMMDDYDVIHVHLPDPMTNLALWFARPNARIVVHWHSDIVQQKKALALYLPLQRWLLARADAIIATSPPYWQSSPWLPEHAGKIRSIPIGIGDRDAKSNADAVGELRAKYANRRIVFSLGRMVYYKGFDHLIDASRLLPDDCVVVIGGSGPLLGRLLARIASEGLSDKVFFPGRIPEHEIGIYFDAADLFCLPSDKRAEAFGVVLLEAMRAGKPLIAADIPGSGVPWVNQDGETGLNVPVGDSAALGKAIARLLGNRELASRFGAGARCRYETHFTADKMVRACLALYEEIVR